MGEEKKKKILSGFSAGSPRSGGGIKIPPIKTGPNQIERLETAYTLSFLKDAMQQQKAARQKAELGNDAVVTGGTVDGLNYKTKQGQQMEAAQEQEKQLFTQSAATAPARAVVKDSLLSLKRLADTVPPPKSGLERYIGMAKNKFMGATQQMPQIDEYNNHRDSILGQFARLMAGEKGTLANRDIDRMKSAFVDIEGDTADRRALGWNRFFDTYNEIAGQYKTLQGEIGNLDKREIMSPTEIGRAALLSGKAEFDKLTDDEIEGVFDGPLTIDGSKHGQPIVPRPIIEKAVVEYERRSLHQKGKTIQ